MTTDQAWAAMTEREKDAVVINALWPDSKTMIHQGIASTWPGMGLVVAEMIERKFWYETDCSPDGTRHSCRWSRRAEPGVTAGFATCDSAPSAAALAAVRAMEKK